METVEILERINNVCRDVFDIENLVVTIDTKMEDVDGWDSLSKVNLIASLAEEFSIKFSMEDVGKMETIGGIVAILEKKCLNELLSI
ncbi:MAG TPA: acyl carrier protein [Chitinispirillaceae bacterium]|nr:acyl carrier protein [Chitinispirillaceae bacterium]